jgi:hypothetical protein
MSIWKVKTDGLNLRSEPRVADGNIVGSMPLAHTVNVLNQGQTWWEVETIIAGDTQRGYVNGSFLRPPLGERREALITNAVQEWLRFQRGNGQEHLSPYYRYVGEYWQALGLSLDGRDRGTPWSAAYISFIVRRAGYGNTFRYAAAHSRYIDDSISKRQNNQPSAFWGYRLNEHAPQLGDLVCQWRINPVTFDNRPPGGYTSHCDVIVEVRNNQVRALGGNVDDSVTMKNFAVQNGHLRAGGQLFAILKNMNPDNPAADEVLEPSEESANNYAQELQKARDRNWFAMFERAANAHNLPLAYILAIASRETNMRNMLGDGGNGVGLMQIDIRYHAIARQAKQAGSWQNDPEPLIDYGASLLRGNYDWARTTWPDFGSAANGRGWYKIAASAYNAGRGGARRGVLQGDSDRYTTGRNYGRDVLARQLSFQALLDA